ncbi:hypothetical protein ACFTAO_22795 [Paenibacillus rhizoplanae]
MNFSPYGGSFLPLSLPVLSTISLFYAVGHWNSYFDAIVYINDSSLMPLQVILRNILLNVATQSADSLANSGAVSTFAVQMAAVVVTTVPILIVYPFMQKHFYQRCTLGIGQRLKSISTGVVTGKP